MSEAQANGAVTPTPGLARVVLEDSGINVNMCFQCGKCAAGCPVAYAMDMAPAQLIHAVRLGLDQVVLNSRTMWLCAACETCTTRCPQDVDIAKVMDTAKIIAVRRGIAPAIGSVRSFHKAALASIKHFGRMWEAGLIMSLKVRTGDYTKDMELGKQMFLKGKMKLFPSFKGSRRAARIFSRVRKAEREVRRQS